MKSTRIRMLQSMAGTDFSLSVGEITERFPTKEAKSLVDAGIAEIAPPEPVKKPETKQEWDEEREKLLGENATLVAENEALTGRTEDLQQQVDALTAFKATVVVALGDRETTVAPPAPEKRG